MASISKCTACFDSENVELIPTPCGDHAFCIDCLRRAVKLAINDERHYPIACGDIECEKLSNMFIIDALSASRGEDQALIDDFEKKAQEYDTLPIRRVYCANERCITMNGESRFINQDHFSNDTKMICPDCGSSTCRRCRGFMDPSLEHVCDSAEYDAEVTKYISTLPENERWLWQKCWACVGWVEKTEACNHMTCVCSADFCLFCGREWPLGLSNCSHGCPHHQEPRYDEDGYNQNGYHRDTGLDRDGFPFDPTIGHLDEGEYDGNDDYDDDDDDDEPVYNDARFDQWGWDREGYDTNGLDTSGRDREGRDQDGFYYYGFNDEGYDRSGFDMHHRDHDGYFDDGCDMDGFDRQGISLQNIPRALCDLEGYDAFGFDVFGYTRAGFDFEGRDHEGYNIEGFDAAGYGRDGYDVGGYDRRGLNHFRRDHDGYDARGYDAHHWNRLDALEPGYYIAPDGNVQQRPNEGPSAEIMACEHQTNFIRGSATCYVCHWTSDIFYHECRLCDAALCRDCDNSGVERQRRVVRNNYPWPGADSFGIEKIFEMAQADE